MVLLRACPQSTRWGTLGAEEISLSLLQPPLHALSLRTTDKDEVLPCGLQ